MASNSGSTRLEELLKEMNMFTREPERFLSEQPGVAQRAKIHTKSMYDTLKKYEPPDQNPDSLPELIIDNFDDEQIWQEIELQNTPSVTHFITNISIILTAKDRLTFDETDQIQMESENESESEKSVSEDIESNDDSDSDVNDLDQDWSALDPDPNDDSSDADLERLLDQVEADGIPDDDDDDDLEEEDDEEAAAPKKSTKAKSSSVDDQFFKLSEMEEFLTQEEGREERRLAGRVEESESEEEEDGDEGQDVMYADFFGGDQRTKKKVSFKTDGNDEDDADEEQIVRTKKLLESDSEGEDADEIIGRKKVQSSYEERQEKMQKKIASLEAASLADKHWQMSGEVGAVARPENSLLQEDLDFDHTSKLPPVITEETTMKLEDLIKQRVKDKAWDDVERKTKTKEEAFEYKKRITLSMEKSKQSLSEIYAQEYMKQNENEDKEKEKDPKHEEVEKMMQSLFLKLDALSNFHYTPKPAIPDVKIVTNMPTIAMEEVAPVSVADGQLLAPEEIKDKQRGVEVGKTERTETDRLRERRQKKTDKRKRLKEKEKRQKLVDKANPGLGNKYSKDKALQQLEKDSKTQPGVTVIKEKSSSNKNVSSKQFFQQLQEEVTTHVRAKKASKTKKKNKDTSSQNFML